MKKQCIVCEKEFEGRADARYDSEACRKSASRGIVTDKLSVTINRDNVTDNSENVTDKVADVTVKADFIPNWKKLGLKSSQEAMTFVLAKLAENSAHEGQVFHLGGMTFEVKNRKMVRIA